jgi:hypothetical protein
MEDLLAEAAEAISPHDEALSRELSALVPPRSGEPAALPDLGLLEQRNRELKQGLELFFAAHDRIKESAPDLDAVRGRMRAHLKEVTLRDLASAQKLIFF